MVDSSGNRRNNAQRLAVRHDTLGALEVANVLIADIDVHKAAQLALLVVELLTKLRVLLDLVRQ